MKTKILNLALALVSITALSSVSMADPASSQAMTRHLIQLNPSAHSQHVLNDRCKADSCCTAKTVTDAMSVARDAKTTFKRVVTCGKTCSIEAKQQRAVCRKGMRA